MQEMLSDLQSVIVGIALDNPEQIAESAQRLGTHKMPKGGLLPYLPADKQDQVGVLPAMESIIGGGTQQLSPQQRRGTWQQLSNRSHR
jgi:hypothetical protein